MKLLALVLLLAVIGPTTAADASLTDAGPLEKFIQGTWRATGTDPTGRHGWFQEWTFTDGKFKETGYPPLEQSGSYRVLKAGRNKLTLELYDQDGTFGTENTQLEIVVNKRRGTIKIGQVGPFRRAPKS